MGTASQSTMEFGEVDRLAINTIRLLAVWSNPFTSRGFWVCLLRHWADKATCPG